MQLTRLDINNLRIIREASVDTAASFVVLYGGNASGKTSFLESIYAVFCGRSFRTRHSSQLINRDADSYLIRANIQAVGATSSRQVATELKSRQAPRYRMDAEDVRPSELARLFPVQLVDASVFDLISGSPAYRRRFFDWGMFHVKHDFYTIWQKQRKLAAHWNALLRRGGKASESELDYWKVPFIESSERLADMRQSYLDDLSAIICSADEQRANQNMFGGSVNIELNRGWPRDIEYADFLMGSLEKDLRERRLRAGAHLFDLTLSVDGRPVKEVLSRGQAKLFGLKLKLAQIKLYNALPDRDSCLVLIDDLAAEVDLENQQKAINEILATGSQVFFTTVDQSQLETVIPSHVDTKMFHVKQGVITELN